MFNINIRSTYWDQINQTVEDMTINMNHAFNNDFGIHLNNIISRHKSLRQLTFRKGEFKAYESKKQQQSIQKIEFDRIIFDKEAFSMMSIDFPHLKYIHFNNHEFWSSYEPIQYDTIYLPDSTIDFLQITVFENNYVISDNILMSVELKSGEEIILKYFLVYPNKKPPSHLEIDQQKFTSLLGSTETNVFHIVAKSIKWLKLSCGHPDYIKARDIMEVSFTT